MPAEERPVRVRCRRSTRTRSRAPVRSVKNGVSSEPTALTCKATPASRGRVGEAARPAACRAPPGAGTGAASRLLEAPEPGRHRERIAGQRAGLIDGPVRRDQVHQIRPPAVRAHRQPAADDLAEARQVRADAERVACAPPGADAEARDHLVEDQHDRRRASHRFAQALQEAVGAAARPHVAGDRLDDDRGDLVPGARSKSRSHRVEVVVAATSSVSAPAARVTPGLVGTPSVSSAGAGLHEERVGVAVVAPLELDDPVAAGGRARDAHARSSRPRSPS